LIFFSVFTNLLMLTGPLFMLQVYDRVLASRSEETLVALFALVGLLYFFYGLIEFARGRVVARVGARLQDALNAPAFRAVLERAAPACAGPRGARCRISTRPRLFSSPVILALFDMPVDARLPGGDLHLPPDAGLGGAGGRCDPDRGAILNQLLTMKKTAIRAAEQAQRPDGLPAGGGGGRVRRGAGHARRDADRWIALQNAAVDQSMRASDWTGSFSSFIRAFRLFLQSAILAVGAWFVLQGS
jgi:ABC-type protease/lipase transport system fused ATPase/permease subunit